jgi:hypothetical protein
LEIKNNYKNNSFVSFSLRHKIEPAYAGQMTAGKISCALLLAWCLACGASSAHAPSANAKPDAGDHHDGSSSADAGHHGNGGHAGGADSDARVATGQNDGDAASLTDASANVQDAATDSGANATSDAGGATSATRACPLVDMCGSHQGKNCPSTVPTGTCTSRDTCYYCQDTATKPTIASTCEGGTWRGSSPQPCAP